MSREKDNSFSLWRELWFPFVFAFILAILAFGGYYLLGQENSLTPEEASKQKVLIQKAVAFLEKINKGEAKEAYEDVAKGFKEAMPYEKFVIFLTDYPLLSHFTKLDPGIPVLEGDVAIVPILVEEKGVSLPVHFTLSQEEGEWKILGFVLNQASSNHDLRDLNALNELTDVANRFLANLREGKIEEAYKNETSSGFQKETPLEIFTSFINERPVFALQTSSSAVDGYIDGNRGFVKLLLDVNGERVPLDFGLRKENEGWKIEGLYLLLTPATKSETPLKEGKNEIIEGSVGLELDKEGKIKVPLKEISHSVDRLHLSVLLETATTNVPLDIVLIHPESGAATYPLTTKIPKEGINRVSFSYNAPANGWPFGKYVFRIKLGGATRDIPFAVIP